MNSPYHDLSFIYLTGRNLKQNPALGGRPSALVYRQACTCTGRQVHMACTHTQYVNYITQTKNHSRCNVIMVFEYFYVHDINYSFKTNVLLISLPALFCLTEMDWFSFSDCEFHKNMASFPYSKVLARRIRNVSCFSGCSCCFQLNTAHFCLAADQDVLCIQYICYSKCGKTVILHISRQTGTFADSALMCKPVNMCIPEPDRNVGGISQCDGKSG